LLSVHERAGSYEYPIEVDPTVVDAQLAEPYGYKSNWRVYPPQPSAFHFREESEVGHLYDYDSETAYARGESGEMTYETSKNSHIYSFTAETSASNLASTVENTAFIISEKGGLEANAALGDSYTAHKTEVCVQAGCASGTVSSSNEGNVAEFKQTATTSSSASFESALLSASVGIVQEKGPTVAANTTSETIGGTPNVFYPGKWLGCKELYQGGVVARYNCYYAAELSATDPGLGISYFYLKYSPESGTGERFGYPPEVCRGVQCPQSLTRTQLATGGSVSGLSTGTNTIEAISEDPVGLKAAVSEKVKADGTLPYNITLTGLPPDGELSSTKQYSLKASAQDGTSAETSGIESLALKIDGKEVGTASGSCSPGPCIAKSNEWLINGSEYANGVHKVVVSATSYARDLATREYTVSVGHKAAPIALAPGLVNPQTGEFFLSATDVSIAGPGGALTVKRSYGSANLTAGAEGPLGPQWALDVGGTDSLTTFEGGVMLTGGEGQQSIFTSKGGGEFTSPPGAASLKLTEVKEGEKTKEFLLKAGNGTVTKFVLPVGGTGSTWVPSTLEGPGATNVKTYKFKTVAGITQPVEVLGPVPAGVSCTQESVSELVKGCRALGFVYSSATTATGDGAAEWGEYAGRLREVTFTAWEPASGKMKTTAVAQYAYDKEGKLRAEWDPRVSPALKTTYGYDAEGRVTALAQPGSQPYLLTYGAIVGDIRTGRILSVTRPSAATAFGDGVAPASTAAPALSTTSPAENAMLSVTNGTWSNSPLSYGYQWERCAKVESVVTCTPIGGATNYNYTPGSSDVGYELRVTVSATNSDATAATTSNLSGRVASAPLGVYTRGLEFGKEGTAEGQLKKPAGIAVDREGHVWVADTGNNRIEEFSASGTFMKAYGKEGTGNLQFKEPKGIAIDEQGYIFVADTGNSRIEELRPSGEYLGKVTLASAPGGLAVATRTITSEKWDALYIAMPASSDIVSYLVPSFERTRFEEGGTFGKAGTGNGQFKELQAIALNYAGRTGTEASTKGLAYVTDSGNHRVQVLKFKGSSALSLEYSSQFGKSGSENGQFSSPGSIADVPGGSYGLLNVLLVMDSGDSRFQQFGESGAYQQQYAEKEAQAIAVGGEKNTAYVANSAKSEITEWTAGSLPIPAPEPPALGSSAVTTVDYNVPVSGSSAPYAMGKSEVETWGEKDDPGEATAIFPPDEPMGWPAKDYKRATIYYLDGNQRQVNVANPGGAISTQEYNAQGDVVRSLSADNRAVSLKESCKSEKECKSAEKAKMLDTENTYNSEGTELVSTLEPKHTFKLASGATVEGRDHKQYSYDEGAPAEGGPYGMPTKTLEGAQYSGKEEDIRETTESYSGQGNLGWKLHKPTSVTTDPQGLKLTHTTVYEASTGAIKETVTPAGNPAEKSAHGSETIYYTTAENTAVPACGEHREWANLPCQTQPAKQPETSGLPKLPVVTTVYNVWDEPEKTTEVVGTTTRTKKTTYDGAGRVLTTGVSSTVGTALPTVTTVYNNETGAPEKLCANEGKACSEGKPKTITSIYNSLGELTSYTDADENTATYTYDVDGRTEKVNDGKGTQTYTYDATTGFPTKLVDSAAGTFTGSYDAEGNLLTEGYPNGMNANYTYNATGKPISLEYVKTTHCTEKCTWFSDKVVPSIHGQWLEQTSTLSHQAYSYDAAGRLTQVQNTPTGKGCTTRAYTYDTDTNRTSLKTYEPNTKGECATEHLTEEKHSYDTADRITDTGTKYSEFGNITALPAADAGGTELTSSYYVDNQLASETQNGQTIGYNLDPAGRTRETVMTGKRAEVITSHYAGAGSAPAWTVNAAGETTRDIPGITGELAAVQNNSEAPVLQLTNLHGDVVATAYVSETATGLASTADTSEYGVPTTSLPPKYSWLGAKEIPTELPSGTIDMGLRSYVPQLGRFLQPDPISGGSANAYSYTFGDPVDTSDPSGALTYGISGWLLEVNDQQDQEVIAREAAREALERAEAERRFREAQEAEGIAGPQYEEEWEEWEEGEEGEEWEYEYVSSHQGTKPGGEEGQVEPAVLVQPLDVEAGADGPDAQGSRVPLCAGGSEGPCAQDARKYRLKAHSNREDFTYYEKCRPSRYTQEKESEPFIDAYVHYRLYGNPANAPGQFVAEGAADGYGPP
jgi:RHS repeat-associated protein